MIKRTYSKRKSQQRAEEPPSSKRRRVETPPLKDCPSSDLPHAIAPSSSSSPAPQRDSMLSDEPTIASTPPSSPPLFRIAPKKPQSKPKTRPAKLTQMTLDLGQATRKKCPQCGMTYTPSNAVDSLFHKKFHAQSIGGVELSRRFVEAVSKEDKNWSGQGGDYIIAIDRSATPSKRKVVDAVMEVVERELGGVGVDGVWGFLDAGGGAAQREKRGEDRYKAFLYIRAHKCVGFLLAERIHEAFPVLPSASATAPLDSSSVSVGTAPRKATMGISRIWTSSSARRAGVAVALLDCATAHFLYGLSIAKEVVAFSQPTDSGGRLAKRWFGRENGWLVYSL
jgi:N-acetyltransferase